MSSKVTLKGLGCWTGRIAVCTVASWLVLSGLKAVARTEASSEPNSKPNSEVVEFNRDIRPIFSDKCFACHGPDSKNRLTKLRFDTEDGAKQDLGGRFAIVPGDPSRSEMVRRITAKEGALRMPPVHSGKSLKDREIALIRRWIGQGAKWQKHWSLIPPRRPELPELSNRNWTRNGVDFFILERLDREGLNPSPAADRATLLRRVSLDLTGLPPIPEEIDAFLNDTTPDAYEKVVDRLLESPRYGERMAVGWLDAARYADTNGYQTDGERSMWRWRDWVIDAFNRNMPFDQFTIEQIAGDMLPKATLAQKIATGFNRNHRGNGEGGIIPEEYAVEYVVDRVETTASVWLGLTLGCARCHDHKYDPLTQKEFYQVFAYFNNVPEEGNAFKYGNSPPFIKAPTVAQQTRLRELEAKLAAAQGQFTQLQPELQEAQRRWERSLDTTRPIHWSNPAGLVARFPLDGVLANDQWRDGEPEFVSGEVGQAANLDGKRFLDAGDVANFSFHHRFTLAAWIYPTSPSGAIVTRTKEIPEETGFGLYLKDGRVQANFIVRWLDDGARVETERLLELNQWHHVLMTYDGSRLAEGIRIFVNGEPQKLRVLLDDMNQPFAVDEPLRIGAGRDPENRFRGYIDEVHIYNFALPPKQAAVLANSMPINEIAAIAPEGRTSAQADKIGRYFMERYAPGHVQRAWNLVTDRRAQTEQLVDSLPTVMVMQERETPRDTFLLIRGSYNRPGERVSPGPPSVLPPLPAGASNNRLGFAKWLVDPSNPLTARVSVNRFWQMYFGVGTVKTVEDFGSQGEWPTHPELLDWLATEFVRSGWDLKALQKTIVTSATYRQSSKATPELRRKDPENRLLARGPRFRLPAETVRDQALAISGLLVEKIGGPSVRPYQPAGLWKELTAGKEQDYKQDKGEKLYRRSLYTFWKRTVPPPAMMIFDSAGREACSVLQTRTNTPLQALNLMNDVTYMEASRVLAQRMMTEGGQSPDQRIRFAFRLATAHWPKPEESGILLRNFQYYLENYRAYREAALKFVSQGEKPRNPKLDVSELAAYTAVASLILNLDETVTKE